MDGLQEAVMIITLLCFFLCHCEWSIHICQTWKYLHAIAILQLFPEHVSANVAWHQISSSQLYRLRICNHYYHCLCFMLFFPGASSYVFMDIAFYTSAAVVVSSGWHSSSCQAGSKPPKSTHSLKHLISYIHVLIRWTSNLNWYSNGTCCYVLASEIQVQLPLKLSFCLRLCRNYKSAFI